MFSFNHLQVSSCTYLVLLIIGMSSALSLQKEQTKTSVPSNEEITVPISGGVNSIEVSDPDVQQFASLGLEKYATDKSYKPMIVKINSATLQIVAGNLYKINVTFGETNCAKGQETNCALKQNAKSETCTIEVLSQPWIDNNHPNATVNC